MIDLTTSYVDLPLKNPLVVSASPLCEEIGNIRKMEDAGAAAVVLHSLFEEQISLESQELDQRLLAGTESFGESLTYFPDMNRYNLGPEGTNYPQAHYACHVASDPPSGITIWPRFVWRCTRSNGTDSHLSAPPAAPQPRPIAAGGSCGRRDGASRSPCSVTGGIAA